MMMRFGHSVKAMAILLAIAGIGPAGLTAAALAQDTGKQDVAAADPQDPFVRGLKRLDERLRMQREADDLARKALELQQEAERLAKEKLEREELGEEGVIIEDEVFIPAPISDPDFFTAFAASNYRLDGLVLSRPERNPVIHIFEEVVKPKGGLLFWAGSERRWIYQRREGEKLAAVARKLIMQPDDILAMNNALRENQLADPMRLYVSPRDNGPLTHIILRGDTLAKLAKIYDTDVPRLRLRNDLDAKDSLTIGKRFLIRDKAIDDRLARMAVPEPEEVADEKLDRARAAYARLGQFEDKAAALRGTREFYAKYYEFMDSDIALRRERDENQKGRLFYNMDIGPLRSRRHGEAFCSLFRQDEMPCLVVYRVPGPERNRNFDSQAIISVSPYVYYDGEDELDSGRTDVEKLTKLEYFLTEGQELGNAEGTIAKITADRIMLTDANGYLLTLPLNKIPEIDPIEKRKAEEAARQAAINQAAAAAGTAAGTAAGAEAPGVLKPEDTGLGKKLQENEAKRREGSGGFIKNLAAKPEKIEK